MKLENDVIDSKYNYSTDETNMYNSNGKTQIIFDIRL